ncbi:anosmin-1 [Coccinella septempunctata]|uniref:anosmin-1 n=1 Tax=Coccinella septempunctata TaxID=41139 RepID=UPI001D078380|nr:anosmin-1 [Coccinella septempunctata]
MMASPIRAVRFAVVFAVAAVLDVATAKTKLRFGHYDSLSVARCEVKCWSKPGKNECIRSCLSKGLNKPGECPENESFISPFATACIKACQQDSQCPSLTKCCQHRCGITCQQPINLKNITDVPEIPRDLIVTEGRRKRTVFVEWKPGGPARENERIIYVLEERHHVGRNFVEEKLSHWSICARTSKLVQPLKNVVKAGTWYQFRVAAVNENGTKGYSENSFTFSISVNPRPPKAPQNMTVTPLWVSNTSLSVQLSWSPPQSDLPIHRYKVFWSRRLHGVKALDSVLVNQQIVPRDQTNFFLNDLQPNSLYFLQIQALVQFGNERLKGEKSGYILNTTSFNNFTNNEIVPLNLNARSKPRGLQLEKIFWSQGELRARISWKPKKGTQRYTVSWWTGSCNESYDGHNHFKVAATTKAYRFDLYDLQFSCRYKVSVRESPPNGSRISEDTILSFSTPSCDSFKNIYRKTKCVNSS